MDKETIPRSKKNKQDARFVTHEAGSPVLSLR